MANVQIKSEKLTPFGGIFSIMEQFDSTLSSVIDSTLGLLGEDFQSLEECRHPYISCPYGLWLMFRGNRQYGGGTVQVVLYSCKQMRSLI